MTLVAIMALLIVVILCLSELLVVWKYLGVLEMHMLAGTGAIFIQNIHHPYSLLLSLWHNQLTIYEHYHQFIVRFFHGKDVNINAAKLKSMSYLCDQLLISYVKFNCLTMYYFRMVSYFLNQCYWINRKLLQRYNVFHHNKAAIKYNHIAGPK